MELNDYKFNRIQVPNIMYSQDDRDSIPGLFYEATFEELTD